MRDHRELLGVDDVEEFDYPRRRRSHVGASDDFSHTRAPEALRVVPRQQYPNYPAGPHHALFDVPEPERV